MHIPPQARRNRTNGCGELREPLTRADLHWKLAMVGADRSSDRAEFRLRPGRASNKARWGADGAGTVELVDKRSLFVAIRLHQAAESVAMVTFFP